jgi:hypothetical protein
VEHDIAGIVQGKRIAAGSRSGLKNGPTPILPTPEYNSAPIAVGGEKRHKLVYWVLEVVPHRLEIDAQPDLCLSPVDVGLAMCDGNTMTWSMIFQKIRAPVMPEQASVGRSVSAPWEKTLEVGDPRRAFLVPLLAQPDSSVDARREELVALKRAVAVLRRELDSHAVDERSAQFGKPLNVFRHANNVSGAFRPG